MSDYPSSGAALRDYLALHYTRLHRRLQRFPGHLGDITVAAAIGSPQAYVVRIACNRAIDCLRGGRLLQYGGGDADILLEQFPDSAPGPEPIAQARSEVAVVDRALQTCRIAINLFSWRCASMN